MLDNSPWVSLLERYETGDFLVIPLTSRKQLRREGKAMDHCVVSFAWECRLGVVRIFSIQHAFDGRRATLSLQLNNGWWDVSECTGYSNCNVLTDYADYDAEWDMMDVKYPSDIKYLSEDVATRYNRANALLKKRIPV